MKYNNIVFLEINEGKVSNKKELLSKYKVINNNLYYETIRFISLKNYSNDYNSMVKWGDVFIYSEGSIEIHSMVNLYYVIGQLNVLKKTIIYLNPKENRDFNYNRITNYYNRTEYNYTLNKFTHNENDYYRLFKLLNDIENNLLYTNKYNPIDYYKPIQLKGKTILKQNLSLLIKDFNITNYTSQNLYYEFSSLLKDRFGLDLLPIEIQNGSVRGFFDLIGIDKLIDLVKTLIFIVPEFKKRSLENKEKEIKIKILKEKLENDKKNNKINIDEKELDNVLKIIEIFEKGDKLGLMRLQLKEKYLISVKNGTLEITQPIINIDETKYLL